MWKSTENKVIIIIIIIIIIEMNNLLRLPQIFIENWAAADFVLRLDTSCGCLEPRRLDTSYDWVKFQQLDTSYGWIHLASVSGSMADLSSGSWIQVTADYILRLARALVAGYDLRLIPSCGWLRVAADSILRLTRVSRLNSTCGWPIL